MEGFRVVGVDTDGGVLCQDLSTMKIYNCGESLEEFGLNNLTEEEVRLNARATS
jgi:hypothetical protein